MLPRPCAEVQGGRIVFLGTPVITGPAQVRGTFKKARLLGGSGNVTIELSVGPHDSVAALASATRENVASLPAKQATRWAARSVRPSTG